MAVDLNSLPNFNPGPSRQSRDMAQQQQQAQLEERQINADSLRLANQKARATYNANQAIRGLLANNPRASVEEMFKVGGPEALPIVKDIIDQQKAETEQAKAIYEHHAKVLGEIGNHALALSGMEPDQRQEANRQWVQRMAQEKIIDQSMANDLLDDDLSDAGLRYAMEQAGMHQQMFDQRQKEITDAQDIATKRAQELASLASAANSTASKEQTEAETERIRAGLSPEPKAPVPGQDIPYPPAVAEQRIEERKATRVDPAVTIDTVNEKGEAVKKVLPRSQAVGKEFAAPPTADMRNKEQAKGMVDRSIQAVKAYSDKLITQRGIAQRATATGRSIEAALGNDPEYRTYQDARMALAGNLAVRQQGSRPSDADIKSIWLPLVPDVFRDTDQSAAMKWELINTMSGTGAAGGAVEEWERVNGKLQRKKK